MQCQRDFRCRATHTHNRARPFTQEYTRIAAAVPRSNRKRSAGDEQDYHSMAKRCHASLLNDAEAKMRHARTFDHSDAFHANRIRSEAVEQPALCAKKEANSHRNSVRPAGSGRTPA